MVCFYFRSRSYPRLQLLDEVFGSLKNPAAAHGGLKQGSEASASRWRPPKTILDRPSRCTSGRTQLKGERVSPTVPSSQGKLMAKKAVAKAKAWLKAPVKPSAKISTARDIPPLRGLPAEEGHAGHARGVRDHPIHSWVQESSREASRT